MGIAEIEGRLEGLMTNEAVEESRPELKGIGDAEAMGVGSAEDCWPLNAYSDVVLDWSSCTS